MSALVPYASPRDEGDALWVTGGRYTWKATGARTDGQYSLCEVSGPAGYVIPIHQHEREHEGFYVAEGLVTLFLGDEVRPLEVGGFGFAPAGFDHSFRLDSDDARLVLLITPGAAGHEGMFAEMGEPASGPGLPPPSDVMPDPEALGAIAARHGTIITGPPPGA